MNPQLDYLLHRAIQYLQDENFESAALLLKQIIRAQSNHSEALRLMGVTLARLGNDGEALDYIKKSIQINKRNGITHSNMGNILLSSGKVPEAILAYKKAIDLAPKYSEVHGNLGNALQELLDFEGASKSYLTAISLDPGNPDFYCHLGNALLAMGNSGDAKEAYSKALELNSNHADSLYYLALLNLYEFNFFDGWQGNEWRWMSNGSNSPALKTSIKRWGGTPISGNLLIWSEQGIGDQILYASMLREAQKFSNSITVSLDAKLLPVFRRSFPEYRFINKSDLIPEDEFNSQIPIGSLGNFFRTSIEDFSKSTMPYLVPNSILTQNFKSNQLFSKKLTCGLSWRSVNRVRGKNKSMNLEDLSPILSLYKEINFINLQYGDTSLERSNLNKNTGPFIQDFPDIDLYDDIENVLSLIEACNIVVTTSNSTAHLAGAIGKETLLLLPYSAGALWYWHDLNGFSPWYPSIKIFRQSKQGDWSRPVTEAKKYLEKRFAI